MAQRRAAAASPRATFDGVKRALADWTEKSGDAWPPGLTLLTGDDLYHLDLTQRALLKALVPAEATEFALTVYGDEKVELSTVIHAARSVAMFAERRVVLVRELSALTGDIEVLEAYTESPPSNSYLIVRAPDLDQRRKLHKLLVSAGKTLRFERPRFTDLRQSVRELEHLAKAKGLSLEPAAAAYLAESVGDDLYAVDAELEKLAARLAKEKRPKVTQALAREMVSSGEILSGWEVADAVLKRDANAATAAVVRLVDAGDEPIRIVGGVAWRARVMLQAKALLEQGRPAQQVIQATRAWPYRRELLDGLSRYSLAELLRFPSILLAADRRLKSSSLGGRAVLEKMVDDLIRPN